MAQYYACITTYNYKVTTDLTLYDFYLSNQLERLFVFLPRGENLIILFSPFNQPLAWFSYSFMCWKRYIRKDTSFFLIPVVYSVLNIVIENKNV